MRLDFSELRARARAGGARLHRGGRRAAATASRSGRRTRWEWIVAALGLAVRRRRAGAAQHAASRAREAAVRSCARAARALLLHRDGLPRRRLRRRARGARRCPTLERVVMLRGDAPGATRLRASSWPRARGVGGRGARARRRGRARTTSPTCSSPRARPGGPKGVMTRARPEPARLRHLDRRASACARAIAT